MWGVLYNITVTLTMAVGESLYHIPKVHVKALDLTGTIAPSYCILSGPSDAASHLSWTTLLCHTRTSAARSGFGDASHVEVW